MTGIPASPDAGAAPAAVRVLDPGYRRYAMGLLLVVYILNFIDRAVINILAEPIKNELGLLDWQIGMMSGLAFALFYTVLGLPIARYAERGHRPRIIAAALAAWSAFTALSGMAHSFLHLVLARIGVGIGEAGCTPPAHSLIADMAPKEKRASALAFYSMGVPLGSLVGMGLGGVIADAWGWRAAFIVCGLPGLVVAGIVALTLVEPRAKAAADAARAAMGAASAQGATFAEAMAVLVRKRTFWLVAFAAAVQAFIGYGHAPFTASFFFRNHAAEVSRTAAMFGLESAGFLGLAIGVVAGAGGVLGTWLGGWSADRFGARDLRAYVSVPAIAGCVSIPIYVLAISLPTANGAIGLLTLNAILGSLWYGPVYATTQSIVPAHMRATAAAILLFIINLVGLGLGPLAVGAMSDVFALQFGLGKAEGVRWALIAAALTGLIAAALFWAARATIRDEMEG